METATANYSVDPINGKMTRVDNVYIESAKATTDIGNAERLVKYYGDRLRYCYDRKRWLIWNEKVWEWDTGAKIAAVAKATVRNIYHEAGDETDDKRRKELADHAKRSESDHRINAMMDLAQSELGIPIQLTQLDRDPCLFNCLNGTVDLRTGELLHHSKADLITILIPTEYNTDAQCPRWLSFLSRVTGEDDDLLAYLQRAVGYSLTGDTKNQVIFLLYGLGNNGKSTFTMTIRKLMAGYAERLDADDLMMKDGRHGGGPREGIANLINKRYVVGSELQDGRRLDVSFIKDMTGGETVKARRLYEHEIEFMPTHKLWLYGNHKPIIADSTLSIWRRVKQIPFDVTIPDAEVDPDLQVELEKELPGILAWAVKGCLAWQQYGLNEPEAVTTATAKYRHDQDILGDFIEDCCVLEPLATVPKAELKEDYQKWCQDNGVEPVTQKTFKKRLEEKGIGDGRVGKARYWKGICLRTDADGTILSDKSDKTSGDLNTKVTKGNHSPKSFPIKEKQKKFIAKPVSAVTDVTKDESSDTNCHICGGNDWWVGPGGNKLCSRCHPQPGGEYA